ncbi:MAG: DUF4118 domain-containing protein [Metallibacterium sp.]
MAAEHTDARPDPDALLQRVQREASAAARGRLKIFFGASAGVGKSYAMLEAARKQAAVGIDVVVGYIELHGRAETEALLEGLQILPPQRLQHRGITLAEFDLDAALLRRPALLLVDELAHTNHAGARHAKRWQDVVELLDAGIDVYTTVNVQHVESLNDVVAQITGVRVRETVPDSVFESADEVELIDLPPDDLIERLHEGKVYLPEKARHAVDAFFRKGNLIALRQLALRATADRVDAAMREYREHHAITGTWAAGERVLVCVGPDALSEQLVRRARRLSNSLHGEWLAVYVETPQLQHLPQAARDRVLRTLKLAESLGAQTDNLSGEHVAEELLNFARRRNVSKIIVGKPMRTRWRDRLRPSLVDALIRGSGDIDVLVTTSEPGAAVAAMPRLPRRSSRRPAYIKGLVAVLLATVLCAALFRVLGPTNLVMIYLLAVVWVAARYGRGPSVLAAVTSVVLFDFLFVEPYFSFAVSDTQYLLTFVVMLTVGLTISNLTAQSRRRAAVARHRERRMRSLNALSSELARERSRESLVEVLRRHILRAVGGQAAVLFPDATGHLRDADFFCTRGHAPPPGQTWFPVPGNDLGIAQWAYDHQRNAGLGTDTLASADAVYLPLKALQRCIGVLGLRPREPRQLQVPEQMHALDAMVNQAAIAIERVELATTARNAGIEIESERLRNAMLSSISHDFRTPLATIIGAATTLLSDAPAGIDEAHRRTLLQSLLAEAERLHRLSGNLLDLSRFDTGGPRLKREWLAIDELIGAALAQLHGALGQRPLRIDLAPDLPLFPGDETLIGQLLINLIENAIKHTPASSAIEVAAQADADWLHVAVRDRGPGLPAGDAQRLFEKFQRGRAEDAQSGFGLGLSIARAIVLAHGGQINAQARAGGGAEFAFTLPLHRAEQPGGD